MGPSFDPDRVVDPVIDFLAGEHPEDNRTQDPDPPNQDDRQPSAGRQASIGEEKGQVDEDEPEEQ